MLQSMTGLDIEIIYQAWGVMLPLARQFNFSVYDAAYLALAQATGESLLTGDLRLYNSVHPHLEWVLWIEDYPI
jgi:predicted nucleic acid-binding protein